MSLLSIVQNVCRAIGKEPPTAVVSSGDSTILELFILSTKSGQELAGGYDFPELKKEATWSATASTSQGNLIGLSATAVVSGCDYDRMIPDTFWDRTARLQIYPATEPQWQQLVAMVSTPLPPVFLVIQQTLNILPVRSSGNTLGFMYFSNKWCQSSTGTAQSAWALDTDTGIIPENILELDLLWRWKQAKGRAYAEDLETAGRSIDAYTGAAPGRRLLILGGGSPGIAPTFGIPEGNWG